MAEEAAVNAGEDISLEEGLLANQEDDDASKEAENSDVERSPRSSLTLSKS